MRLRRLRRGASGAGRAGRPHSAGRRDAIRWTAEPIGPGVGATRPDIVRSTDRVEGEMNLIEPYSVWIGHGGEALDLLRLLDAGIEAVVELAVEEPSFAPRRDMIACRFPLVDGVGNPPHVLTLAIRTVAALLVAKVPVLVCCGAGMSRGPPSSPGPWRRSTSSPPNSVSNASPGIIPATSPRASGATSARPRPAASSPIGPSVDDVPVGDGDEPAVILGQEPAQAVLAAERYIDELLLAAETGQVERERVVVVEVQPLRGTRVTELEAALNLAETIGTCSVGDMMTV